VAKWPRLAGSHDAVSRSSLETSNPAPPYRTPTSTLQLLSSALSMIYKKYIFILTTRAIRGILSYGLLEVPLPAPLSLANPRFSISFLESLPHFLVSTRCFIISLLLYFLPRHEGSSATPIASIGCAHFPSHRGYAPVRHNFRISHLEFSRLQNVYKLFICHSYEVHATPCKQNSFKSSICHSYAPRQA
jgi:hypothetical protein